MEEKPPLRACDIAEEYFKKELAINHGPTTGTTAGTIVIVHDQCYGHRFSRPKTKASALSMIVERPERILASVLGISTAYVRLGGRHADSSHAPHPDLKLADRIPFKILKTSRVVDITSPVVTNVHGVKWMEELKTMCLNAERKLASNGKELSREGANPPGQPPKEKFHEGDLYLCTESLNAFQGALGGVLDAVDAVFQGASTGSGPSRAFVCVRPPGHHCSADFPSGFCWINNVHVGIEHAALAHGLTHAAIIDFDLHHGDGSQDVTWARNKKALKAAKNAASAKKTSIGYFSLHDINSYPCEWGDDEKVQAASLCIENAHGQTVWNVHLQPWKTETEFWTLYEEKYLTLIEKARQYLKNQTRRLTELSNTPPKAAIFLSAGFDASEWESQGMQRHKVNVPTEFYARFTRDVVQLAQEEGIGVDGRIISVLEGGYSDRALTTGVLSHVSGLTDGQVRSGAASDGGLAFEMGHRLGALSLKEENGSDATPDCEDALVAYDPEWWQESRMSELESLVHPAPVVAPKKPRVGAPPAYYSPTQSFSAKVVDPSKIHRTVSGKFPTSPSRAATPIAPEVDWATAAHALSRLLIPSDRQTQSCLPEELAEVKVKKEKPVPVPAAPRVDPSGRQLRGRKAITSYAEPDTDIDTTSSNRTESRANRRKTIADLPLPSTEAPAPRAVTRRMSIASSIGSVNGERSASRASSVVPPRKSVTPAPGAAANGAPVRKARAAGTTARATKAEPPVPRVPANYLKTQRAPQNKENEVDQLTSGLKRINIKWANKEEEEAREKAKVTEKKPVPKTTTARRAPAARTTKTGTATAAKKPTKMTKAAKPPSPVGTVPQAGPLPEEAKISRTADAPVEQPQPVQASLPIATIEPERPTVSQPMLEPPTELAEMNITPDQLPKTVFTTTMNPLPIITSPPRADTPPQPPPSTIPQFVNYTPHSFGTTSSLQSTLASAAARGPQGQLQWQPPNADVEVAAAAEIALSPRSKPHDLPVFTANGVIPFAPNPNPGVSVATSVPGVPQQVASETAPSSTVGQPGLSHEEPVDIWEVPDMPTR
jgi:histone deacetylase HOS3